VSTISWTISPIKLEVDERVVHRIYDKLVSSGMEGFGAKRWLSTLERQCERLASMLACNIPALW
jgi:homeobox-leucine zipper protein